MIAGRDAAAIVRSVERGVITGALGPGHTLPSVRRLARSLGVSPTTVAAAYRDLRRRGVLVTHDRARTVVAHHPPLPLPADALVPRHLVDLASGNPDPRLLPDLAEAWAAVHPQHHLYGVDPTDTDLLDLAMRDLASDGVPADHVTIVSGALDGIERVLDVHTRPGDAVAVEDPGYTGVLDLVRARGLEPLPIPVDDEGMAPAALAATLARGAQAVIVVPRAQNPTGAALTAARAAHLRVVLEDHPGVLVLEDDHAGWVSGAAYQRVTGARERWAVVRSVAKSLGPDLRVAILAADADTTARVVGRQQLGTGWVSRLLQAVVVRAWRASVAAGTFVNAAATYAQRRETLQQALAERGVASHGASGLNVWVPVAEEVASVQDLAAQGWAVQAGEPYRIGTPPAIRITTAALSTTDAESLATAIVRARGGGRGGRRG